ncbi:hypothetical protein DW781_09315 [Olsenella sp. AM30-3LB]|uniref:hypothetical protein n=1 Tax=Olsenella sp. AM30-3LB TaxID=2292359 RepID=UPI000E47A9CC|nr:hypothetical protein [Olsenella sp. AM30-3LB]RHD72622.1 hypothetical protein DW781_09315 [Olsenella sp. AM30-3LB]
MNNRFESFVDVVYALNKEIQRIKSEKKIQRIKSEKMGSLGLRGIDTMVLYYLFKHAIDLSEADLARLVRQD